MLNDIDKVRLILKNLNSRGQSSPSIPKIAKAAGLSPLQCERIFERWAGIDPNQFLSCLRTNYRASLPITAVCIPKVKNGPVKISRDQSYRNRFAVVDFASNHRSKEVTLKINYGFHSSHFGRCLVGVTIYGICWLSFVESEDSQSIDELQAEWPEAHFRLNPSVTKNIVETYLPMGKSSKGHQITVYLRGTDFQMLVWKALLRRNWKISMVDRTKADTPCMGAR